MSPLARLAFIGGAIVAAAMLTGHALFDGPSDC
jgi:hypothetical protein